MSARPTPRRTWRNISLSMAIGVVLAASLGSSDAANAAGAHASASLGTAVGELSTPFVKGKAPMTGYNRVGDLGAAWLDENHNGCDTRDDILARDLKHAARPGRCKVVSGILGSPYTDVTIHFVRG